MFRGRVVNQSELSAELPRSIISGSASVRGSRQSISQSVSQRAIQSSSDRPHVLVFNDLQGKRCACSPSLLARTHHNDRNNTHSTFHTTTSSSQSPPTSSVPPPSPQYYPQQVSSANPHSPSQPYPQSVLSLLFLPLL